MLQKERTLVQPVGASSCLVVKVNVGWHEQTKNSIHRYAPVVGDSWLGAAAAYHGPSTLWHYDASDKLRLLAHGWA